MNTLLVETYEVESLNGSEIENLAAEGEALAIIEQLGLDGQKNLGGESGSNFPYRQLTAIEHFTFKTLFPNRAKIEDYKAGPIPLRALQVAAFVRQLDSEEFAYLEIWYPAPGIDDPVLVARKNSYSDPVYLLARWGAALKPVEELYEQAKGLVSSKTKAKLLKIKQEVETALADPDSFYAEEIAEGKIPSPSFFK